MDKIISVIIRCVVRAHAYDFLFIISKQREGAKFVMLKKRMRHHPFKPSPVKMFIASTVAGSLQKPVYFFIGIFNLLISHTGLNRSHACNLESLFYQTFFYDTSNKIKPISHYLLFRLASIWQRFHSALTNKKMFFILSV